MTGEEILRELEAKAWARGEEVIREEGARRRVRLVFEVRFGPSPFAFEDALRDLGELDRIMKACPAGAQGEIACILGGGIH